MGTMDEARISRGNERDDLVLVVGDVVIDRPRRTVTVGGRRVRPRRRQFDLLVALAQADGRVLTRSVLLRATGSGAQDPRTRTIDVQIGQLRALLAPSQVAIETVRGVGYRLVVSDDAAEVWPAIAPLGKRNFASILPEAHQSHIPAAYHDPYRQPAG
jgi:DNA-binding response OmpR family regulator